MDGWKPGKEKEDKIETTDLFRKSQELEMRKKK